MSSVAVIAHSGKTLDGGLTLLTTAFVVLLVGGFIAVRYLF